MVRKNNFVTASLVSSLMFLSVLGISCLRKIHADVGPFVVPNAAPTNTPTLTRTPSATPTPCSLAASVDNGSLAFSTWGDAGWFCQNATTYSGGDAAEGGNVGNSQYTVLEAAGSGAGNIAFYWKVSSESGWDYLDFWIDGALQNSISGNTAWAYQTYAVGAGPHVFQWVYDKDTTLSSGSDTGWVDAVTFP